MRSLFCAGKVGSLGAKQHTLRKQSKRACDMITSTVLVLRRHEGVRLETSYQALPRRNHPQKMNRLQKKTPSENKPSLENRASFNTAAPSIAFSNKVSSNKSSYNRPPVHKPLRKVLRNSAGQYSMRCSGFSEQIYYYSG